MYVGELKLEVLALTELVLRPTAQGLVLELQAVLKRRNGISPTGTMSYRRSSNWSRETVALATALVEAMEKECGSELGEGGVAPGAGQGGVLVETDEPGDLASSIGRKEAKLPKQF